MTNQELWRIALEQSAWDCNCAPEDFLRGENKVVQSQKHPKARAYLPLPFACDLVSYGPNIVAQVSPDMRDIVTWYIGKYPVAHCFETPNVMALNDRLEEKGYRVCFMAEYFLPDVEALKELPCPYELRVLQPADFAGLYTEAWSNALCAERAHLDLLAVGAYDGDTLVGLAGCSADGENMWQIGVDVLPAYRRQGVAAAITSRLAVEALKRDKVPFYCAAWSNIPSVRNAIKCGFRPAWVELTARDRAFVDKMNNV